MCVYKIALAKHVEVSIGNLVLVSRVSIDRSLNSQLLDNGMDVYGRNGKSNNSILCEDSSKE